MTRAPNEVWITVELAQQALARGNESRALRVIAGPDPEAQIIGARFDGLHVILVYDRPVEDPCLQEVQGK